MKGLQSLGSLVYSTEAGRICPACCRPVAQCVCKLATHAPVVGDGVVRVQRETKGRAGKAVTLVRGLALSESDLVVLAKQLKAACGCGGTVKDGSVEVQGDHVDKVMALLRAQGHVVKRAGE